MKFFFYRYKFIILFTIIGFTSIIVEQLINYYLKIKISNNNIVTIIGFLSGLFYAYFLNIRFNFNIVKSKRNRALKYFFIISFISFIFQFYIRKYFIEKGISIVESRFLVSGLFFALSYLIHRKITFKDYKKVGVAIYADGIDDIQNIYSKISDVCDFIHLDIVDNTFKDNSTEVKAYKAEVVKAFWQKKEIEAHIMSKKPMNWIDELLPYVNTIYLHLNIDENISEVLNTIKSRGCNAGIVLTVNDNIEDLKPYINLISHILVLSIEKPGFSGQDFNFSIIEKINTLNSLKERGNFQICVDGGVNDKTIAYINTEAVVSGSFVLNAIDPIKNIMHLQTSGHYERY